jgi:hypothetical protein
MDFWGEKKKRGGWEKKFSIQRKEQSITVYIIFMDPTPLK